MHAKNNRLLVVGDPVIGPFWDGVGIGIVASGSPGAAPESTCTLMVVRTRKAPSLLDTNIGYGALVASPDLEGQNQLYHTAPTSVQASKFLHVEDALAAYSELQGVKGELEQIRVTLGGQPAQAAPAEAPAPVGDAAQDGPGPEAATQ